MQETVKLSGSDKSEEIKTGSREERKKHIPCTDFRWVTFSPLNRASMDPICWCIFSSRGSYGDSEEGLGAHLFKI